MPMNPKPARCYPGLPPVSYASPDMGHGAPRVIQITRGESGYRPVLSRTSAAELNAEAGVTPQQAEAMLAGSMFGWDVPAADPRRYDADGRPIRNRMTTTAAAE